MSQIPVVFFQACATAIPTLLIAAAVGARFGHTMAAGLQNGPRPLRVTAGLVLLLLMLYIAAAEMVCLLAIAGGGGNYWAASVAIATVNMLVLIVGIEWSLPVVRMMRMKRATAWLVVLAITWGLLSVIGSVVLVTITTG